MNQSRLLLSCLRAGSSSLASSHAAALVSCCGLTVCCSGAARLQTVGPVRPSARLTGPTAETRLSRPPQDCRSFACFGLWLKPPCQCLLARFPSLYVHLTKPAENNNCTDASLVFVCIRSAPRPEEPDWGGRFVELKLNRFPSEPAAPDSASVLAAFFRRSWNSCGSFLHPWIAMTTAVALIWPPPRPTVGEAAPPPSRANEVH